MRVRRRSCLPLSDNLARLGALALAGALLPPPRVELRQFLPAYGNTCSFPIVDRRLRTITSWTSVDNG